MDSNERKKFMAVGDYIWYKPNQSTARIKKHECWEIIEIKEDLNIVYLRKIGRKVLTQKDLNEIEENCLVFSKTEIEKIQLNRMIFYDCGL